ncbi:hypothetical protein BGZ76_010396 [Entomortierella beljakovae]|nr:hypothetical protein BGZ76_010396 [Entomortierella beljakovae]
MPLLIHAVPFTKSWTGTYTWKPTKLEDLPIELEYLSYQEFEDRFKRLNDIARPIFPTIWPNIAIIIFIAGLATAAAIGISYTGTNMSILGQGGCFLLPIIIIIWIKVRSGVNARARRKFKHQSLKLLRAWSAEDAEAYAIQWKLRHRTIEVAKKWLGRRDRQQQQQQQQQQPQQHWQITNNDIGNLQSINHAINNANTPIQQPSLQQQQQQQQQQVNNNNQHEIVYAGTQQTYDYNSMSQTVLEPPQQQDLTSLSSVSIPTVTVPSLAVTSSNQQNGHRASSADTDTRSDSAVRIDTERINTNITTTTTTDATTTTTVIADTAAAVDTSRPGLVSTGSNISTDTTPRARVGFYSQLRAYIKDCLEAKSNLSRFFFDQKVWLIEISIRDCQLDDYALTVPTPVYCDYRLPGYEDVMSAGQDIRRSQTNLIGGRLGSSSSRLALNRYIGEPPAYSSDSDDDDDDDEEDDDNRAQYTGSPNVSVGSRQHPGNNTFESQQSPSMTMVQRSSDLTSILIVTSSRENIDNPNSSLNLATIDEDDLVSVSESTLSITAK